MRLLLLQLAALSSAFILPNEQVSSLRHVQVESSRAAKSAVDRLPSKSELLHDLEATFGHISDEMEDTFEHVSEEMEDKFNEFSKHSKDIFDEAHEAAQDIGFQAKDKFDEYSEQSRHAIEEALDAAEDVSSEAEANLNDYLEQSKNALNDAWEDAQEAGVHAKASIKDSYDDAQSWLESTMDKLDDLDSEDVFGHHGHHGHHGGHHHHKPNMTVYQLISKSKYTTKLAKIIDKYDDLIEALNGTAANYTVFAPTNEAFDKIPKHHEPSKEVIEKILTYHVSPEFYPAGRILGARTIPTLYKSKVLGKHPMPQRLSTSIGLRGLTINHYARVVAIDIFGTNGVIHGVNSLLLPPPPAVKVIDLLPSDLSTLELGLVKTGLFDQLNTTKNEGGTLFAPENFAFKKLGHHINAFLFSPYGRKYLRALLEYHIIPGQTLYSDAFYKGSSKGETTSIPKGIFHADLPTLLKDRNLSVDVARYGRLIEIKINAFSRVIDSDAVCADGVIHIVGDVLIPPKKLANGEMQEWDGVTELTEEDLKERLEPFVTDDSHWEEL